MRRMIAVFLAVLVFAALAACGRNTADANSGTDAPREGTLAGGWQRTESPAVTEEIREHMEQAASKLIGARYIPVACVGRQIVSGTNYLLVCRVAPVVPDAKEHWSVVTLYTDLDGDSEITDVRDFPGETFLGGKGPGGGWSRPAGAWSQPQTPDITEDARKAFDKATEGLLGMKYEALALLSTQPVSGTNYCFFCEGTTVVPGEPAGLYLIKVYSDLQGGAEILEITALKSEQTAG